MNLVSEFFWGKIFLYLSVFDCQKQDCVDYGDPLKLYTGATVYNKNTTTQNITVKQCCCIIINEQSRIVYIHYCLIVMTNPPGSGYKRRSVVKYKTVGLQDSVQNCVQRIV